MVESKMTKRTARVYTKDEAKAIFLKRIRSIVTESARVKSDPTEAASLTAFSILCLLDGATCGFPAIDIHLAPHESDKEFHESLDENWFEEDMVLNDDAHMHEEYLNGRS